MFGFSALLECADCKPERILSEEETKNLFQQYLQLREQELSDNWAQVEQKIINPNFRTQLKGGKYNEISKQKRI